jgi:hypothetical protein
MMTATMGNDNDNDHYDNDNNNKENKICCSGGRQ